MPKRSLALSAVLALAALAAAGPALADPPAPPAVTGAISVSSSSLTVELDPAFPRVLRYVAGGAVMGGSVAPVTQVTLNGRPYAVTSALGGNDGRTARYTLTFADLPGVELDASIGVEDLVTTFRIDAVRDIEAFRVATIDIPGHDLVSVGSDQQGAATAFTKLDSNRTRTADRFAQVTSATPAEQAPVGATYAIVNTGALAASIESNSTYDKPSGQSGADGARFWHQARKLPDGTTRVGVWSGQWTYRGEGAPFTSELPWAKVVITPDANGDGLVDWQDGAIAFRGIGVKALGADQTKDRVVTHIPFNFASQATHPFLRTLDDVKRISLATDGLGQFVLLKGYQSEGHDSAHPDYGGNYNTRAGGLKDLNRLLRAGKDWGATFGVHVNATEAYGEAKTFDEKLVDKNARGWDWLNQSYYIDQRHDLASGNLAKRFALLREETDRNLAMLYLDVYYTHGWIADQTLAELREQGWQVSSEWATKLERSSLWSHWATDESYGGVTDKGLNSQIIRFIRNQEKDVWNPDPILGNARIEEFEGWTGENDWHAFYRNIWEHNLPAKFMQQQPIMKWAPGEIRLAGGVRGTTTGGRRELFVGGRKVLDGATYLLPWQGRYYHYNPAGGATTWDVAESRLRVHKLTDQGRVEAGEVTAVNGKVTLNAEAGVPYVLFPGEPAKRDRPQWGEGSGIVDPGFNADDLRKWESTGQVSVDRSATGQRVALLAAGSPASIEQNLKELVPGRSYTASAWIEVEPGRSRRTVLEIDGPKGLREQVAFDRSTAMNLVAADEKHGTYFQRVKLSFTATKSHATIRLRAGEGDGAVRADDFRLVEIEPTGAVEGFELVDQGWGPFIKGDAGGSTDPRTHLINKHAPYTQKGWNGKAVDDVLDGEWSLKAHEERKGLVYRTAPFTQRFEPGHAYEVSFDYQAALPGTYAWVSGYDKNGQSVEIRQSPLEQKTITTRFTERLVAGCGDMWVGLRSLQPERDGADLILDNFSVKDLGASAGQPACASLTVQPSAEVFEPGIANDLTTTFTNLEDVAATDVRVAVTVPQGWKLEGESVSPSVAPGQRLATTWKVTPPIDAAYRSYPIAAKLTYTAGGVAKTLEGSASVRTMPPPPSTDVYAGDIDWIFASNGWGPVERDQSNGEQGQGDGRPITIGGRSFAKGLGTHAPATVRYFLGGRCTALSAWVGVDDVQTSRGSVQFTVKADSRTVAQSPVLRAADAAHQLKADLTGARHVELVVGDGGDGNGNDHADWGEARLSCH
ncbi:endo-alpha-N-acetylgalactosaminidase family protein [Nonomuraea dietziae]|uniref:Endo-alpha-N-acetylgalactosaminidase n=1 Tax=Nonomuraea dietziae TaxID=65515 RepID=A0A7W5VHQ4_9ACTN|nr:endo-alpha-N-acetylgalactosaminidase family protein [Nonomuraea dietziae]MBB3732270.1 endo-alpha-N-acetylgalactosaminidase [Nonomuraea dietziae]